MSSVELFPRFRAAFWVAAVVAIAAVAVILGSKYVAHEAPWALYDEWICADGEVPTVDGSACVDPATTDPSQLSPLGNRPMECSGRSGWTEIVDPATLEQDCLKDGLAMPEGWKKVAS